MPPGMEQFFCLHEDVTVDEVKEITGENFELSALQGSHCCPCIIVLPMGFNWSLYLIQVLHEQASSQALEVSRSHVFLEGHPAPVVSEASCATMPYCDNVHVLSLSSKLCQEAKDRICDRLERIGFELHEHTAASTMTATLGGTIDGELGLIRCSSNRT